MADLSLPPLLEPLVLQGVVAQFTAPEALVMLSRVNQVPQDAPAVSWDIIKGSRQVANVNVPDAEADVVQGLGRQSQSARVYSIREKKAFQPTTLRWLRAPGSLNVARATDAIMREIQDLNQRFDNLAETMLLGAMTGTLSMTVKGVAQTVDYLFPSSHKISAPGTAWASQTPVGIARDVQGWKRLLARHGRVPAREAIANEFTINEIVNAFANASNGGSAAAIPILSDRMKDQYYSTGMLPGFMGLDWTVSEAVYEDNNGNLKLFVPDNALYIGNYTDNRPIELWVGPTPDVDAPEGFAGKYAKTFRLPDPSTLQYLLDWQVVPVIQRPYQMLFVTNVGFDTTKDSAFLN